MFQKLREAALAYHLERQWSKDKILTEYLNEIYFGEGATGIEAAAAHLLRLQPPGLRRGWRSTAAPRSSLPWEAALLAGMISSPSAYSPRNFPENALGSPQPGAREHGRPGLHHPGGVRPLQPRRGRDGDPDREGDPARRPRTPRRRTSPRGCASSSSTATAPARRSAAACRSSRRSTSSSSARPRASSAPRSAASARRPRWSCSTTRPADVLAMVGGPSYQDAPFNLADERPPPARVVVQAVHADHRARAGPLPRRGLHVGAAADPVPREGAEEATARARRS